MKKWNELAYFQREGSGLPSAFLLVEEQMLSPDITATAQVVSVAAFRQMVAEDEVQLLREENGIIVCSPTNEERELMKSKKALKSYPEYHDFADYLRDDISLTEGRGAHFSLMSVGKQLGHTVISMFWHWDGFDDNTIRAAAAQRCVLSMTHVNTGVLYGDKNYVVSFLSGLGIPMTVNVDLFRRESPMTRLKAPLTSRVAPEVVEQVVAELEFFNDSCLRKSTTVISGVTKMNLE